MKFRDYFSLKNIIFAVIVIALMLGFAMRQASNTVKVKFGDTSVAITSSKYNMTIAYEDIVSVELADMADPGEMGSDGYDDEILRAGNWTNETWGEYHICAYLETSKCVVIEVEDGRTLVFSKKNDKTTTELYETLLTYLPE